MNLQQLEHLVAMAETRSFSRAADRVHLTQSALSRSIQGLEEELGIPLVDRIGKRNELTAFGVEIVARAKRISMEVADIKQSAHLLKQGRAGRVAIGMGSASRAVLAGPLMEHMLLQHPGVRLQLTGGSHVSQLVALRERIVDALLVTHHVLPEFEGLNIELMEPLVPGFLCRSGHPLAGKEEVSFEDLRQFPVLSTVISSEVARKLVELYGPDSNPQTWLRGTDEDVSTLIRAVLRTDAIFWGVLAVASSFPDGGTLVELQIRPGPGITSRLAFVTLAGRTTTPALEAVRQFSVEHIKFLAGNPSHGTSGPVGS